jgi:glycosyltransferase involved in cell wall biosynthesis
MRYECRLSRFSAEHYKSTEQGVRMTGKSGDPAGPPRLLAIGTRHAGHARASGYRQLTSHLPHAEVIETRLRQPRYPATRLLHGAFSRLTFSHWYYSSGARVELGAWKRLLTGYCGIVHVLSADTDLGFLDLSFRRRCRLVATFHACDDTLPRIFRWPSRIRRLDAAVIVSETQRSFLDRTGLPANKIYRVLHGVDTTRFSPGVIPKSERMIVISVGSYRRNFTLLRRVCEAMQSEPDVEFWVISSETVPSMLEGLANVRLLSSVSDEELIDAYRRAGCFLLTVENATANNALLESMACGLPIVAERVGGVPEYVNCNCAFLTAPGEADEIVLALRRLRDHPETRLRMGHNARQRALDLDWRNTAAAMIDIYAQLDQNLWRTRGRPTGREPPPAGRARSGT